MVISTRDNATSASGRTDGGTGGELHPVLRVGAREELVPRPHGVVPPEHAPRRHVAKHTAIVVVPPHRLQLAGDRVVPEDGPRGLVERVFFAGGVRGDGDGGEQVVDVGVQLFEDRGDVEAVDEERRAACAVGVREEMEELDAAGIGLPWMSILNTCEGGRSDARSRCCRCGR